jgi:hypothetical protein
MASSIVILFVLRCDKAAAFRIAILISASGDNFAFFGASTSPLRVDFLTTGLAFPLSLSFFAHRMADVDI